LTATSGELTSRSELHATNECRRPNAPLRRLLQREIRLGSKKATNEAKTLEKEAIPLATSFGIWLATNERKNVWTNFHGKSSNSRPIEPRRGGYEGNPI
jgi:hypothetical protein